MTDNDEMGLDFGPLADDLAAADYPLTNGELLERYGDREIRYANGTESLREVLGPIEDDYESADEVEQAILNMVSEDADGRLNYTDRGVTSHEDDNDQQSL
jgi:hypothetical protein